MEIRDIEAAIEAILFASGEAVSVDRISAVLAVPTELVLDTATHLADKLSYDRRGIRLLRLDNALQLCSAPEYGDLVRSALETRKMPQLSQPALEVLAIVAYFQPVTRAYVEQVRGVDSSYTVSLLQERGFIEPCGYLDAPGRPRLFRTTKMFLRVFGISSIAELPDLPEPVGDEDGQLRIQNAINLLSEKSTEVQDGAGEKNS